MHQPTVSQIPIDPKNPMYRTTFADVAMRIVHDGPMYGVFILVGILAVSKNIEGLNAILGAALALQARSRPPEANDKLDKMLRGAAAGMAALVICAGYTGACTP